MNIIKNAYASTFGSAVIGNIYSNVLKSADIGLE